MHASENTLILIFQLEARMPPKGKSNFAFMKMTILGNNGYILFFDQCILKLQLLLIDLTQNKHQVLHTQRLNGNL